MILFGIALHDHADIYAPKYARAVICADLRDAEQNAFLLTFELLYPKENAYQF